jgi:hypothetical protein
LFGYRKQQIERTKPTNAPFMVMEGTSVRATGMYYFPTPTYHRLQCRVFISLHWQFLANMPTP